MRLRIVLAGFLRRLGRFISSLAIMVMRPDDLVELSRRHYAGSEQVTHWTSAETMDQGLTPLEREILKKTNLTQGKALVLMCGGGREAIPLAKMGFAVTGVDFIPELVEQAQENAAKQGVQIEAQVGEITQLALPPATFDLVWLSDRMYSCIPTQKKRIAMLKKMHQALRPGGWFTCMFYWSATSSFSPAMEWLRKAFAYLSLGNISYETGDFLLGEIFFVHRFGNEADLDAEFTAGGFEVIRPYLIKPEEYRGMALLHKAA